MLTRYYEPGSLEVLDVSRYPSEKSGSPGLTERRPMPAARASRFLQCRVSPALLLIELEPGIARVARSTEGSCCALYSLVRAVSAEHRNAKRVRRDRGSSGRGEANDGSDTVDFSHYRRAGIDMRYTEGPPVSWRGETSSRAQERGKSSLLGRVLAP